MTAEEAHEALTAALIGDEPDYDEPVITPDDERHAARLLRALGYYGARLSEHVEAVRDEVERIEAHLAEVSHPLVQRIEYLTGVLADYHAARLADDPKAKTIKLLTGKLSSRAAQPRVIFGAGFLDWVSENRPELLVPQDPKLDVAAAKKLLELPDLTDVSPGTIVEPRIDGVPVPGATVEFVGRTFAANPS